jgi:ethanolamine ammonia-lyase small subunit
MSDLEPKPEAGSLDLKSLTSARVGLGRTGSSQTTQDVLEFSLAHAEARDAVHASLSLPTLLQALTKRALNPIAVRSAAPDRATYLRRPDLGRTLSEASRSLLKPQPRTGNTLCVVIADGLSAIAVDRNALPLLDALLPLLTRHFELAPVVVAEQARVALGDEIGHLLAADLTVVLIGERPGLSAADSLGAYITWTPRPDRTDAERNCISNIREQGLNFQTAAAKIAYLCREVSRLGVSGTAVKEEAETKGIGP